MLRNTVFLHAGVAALVSLGLGAPVQAQAVPASVGATVGAGAYGFHIAVGSVFADGTILANASGHATSISGLVNNTDAITGLSSYAGADNDLYGSGAWVTFAGLSFSTKALGNFNFYNSGLGYYGMLNSFTNPAGVPDGLVATAKVTAVPEPRTWALMWAGFAAVGIFARRTRRSRKSIAQAA